jgi:hypothetical protein
MFMKRPVIPGSYGFGNLLKWAFFIIVAALIVYFLIQGF